MSPRVWICAVAAAMVVASAAGDEVRPRTQAVQLVSCAVADVAARCGTLPVPENRATDSGRVIDLRIVVVEARGDRRLPDPIFWLAGGPGGAATDDAPGVVRFLQEANQRRDLVFVDQRGTGGSNNLVCPKGTDATRWADEVGTCLASLPADAAAYTTAWAMDDVDDVRAALGYPTINLYGGSYGATSAQVYLQRHRAHVRTATLLSGTPLDVPLFERFPISSQFALDALFTRCAADPACHKAFPDPAADLRAVAARLEAGAVELPLTDPATNQPVRFTRQNLGPGVHSMLLDAQAAVVLPMLLHATAGGDFGAVAAAVTQSGPSSPPTWQVMNLTIMCHEPWALLRPEQTRAASVGSYLSYEDVRALTVPEDVCAAVPRPDPAALYHEPVTASVPMLLLNGSVDPQDPPAGVVSVDRTYPKSLAVTMPGQAHQYAASSCLVSVITRFIDTASTVDLPTDCLDRTSSPPFRLG